MEWIEKIKKTKTGKELAKLWDEMKETAFLSYKVDPKTIDANVKDFADLSIADQKKFLIECLDKNFNRIHISYWPFKVPIIDFNIVLNFQYTVR